MASRSTRVGGRRGRMFQRESSPSRSSSQHGSRKTSEVSLGSVIASCRRRAAISTVFKTLRLGKMDPNNIPVTVGRDTRERLKGDGQGRRTLGVSLLGACTSKGCPTKSDENEDRYVHGKLLLPLDALKRGRTVRAGGDVHGKLPCWGFATFDGHAGAACAQYLKENFLGFLRQSTLLYAKQHPRRRHSSCAPDGRQRSRDLNDNKDQNGQASRRSRSSSRTRSNSRANGRSDKEECLDSEEPPCQPVEVVLARLLTDTLASLTRSFEKEALASGEISGACVIAGLYCEGALVLANIGDCQAVYHGQVKSAPGAPVTAQTTIHDATNGAEVARCLSAGGFISPTGRFQGVLEPSRTVGDVDVKADAPNGCIASYPELFKVDIASEIFRGDETSMIPPFLVLATDGIWNEASANTVVTEVKDGIAKIQAHKRRFAVRKNHRRNHSTGSTTFTDGESDSEAEEPSEFCGSGEWADRGMDLAERVVSLARGRYDDATALVVVFE